MRGLDTPIRKIRREVFREIAAVAFESDQDHFKAEIEAIPYRIVQERARYRDSIYRERAVASERVRLAMGMSLRPENKAVHITAGMEKSNIDEKYYEPPLTIRISIGLRRLRTKQLRSQRYVPRMRGASLPPGLPQGSYHHQKGEIHHRSGKMHPLRQVQAGLPL